MDRDHRAAPRRQLRGPRNSGFPEPPLEWDVVEGPAVAVSDDRTAARTSGVVLPTETEFSSFWTITPGDPNGPYLLIVKVSDGVVAEFTFNVVTAQ